MVGAGVQPTTVEPPAVEPAEPPAAWVPPAAAVLPPIPLVLVVPPVALVPPVAVPGCVVELPPEFTLPPVAFVPPVALVPPVAFVPPVRVLTALVPPVADLVLVLPPELAPPTEPPMESRPPTADEPPPPEARLLSDLSLEHAGSATTTAAQKRIDLFIFLHSQACIVNRFQIVAPRIAGIKEELAAQSANLSRTKILQRDSKTMVRRNSCAIAIWLTESPARRHSTVKALAIDTARSNDATESG